MRSSGAKVVLGAWLALCACEEREPAPPVLAQTFVELESLLTTWAERGEEPRSGLWLSVDSFRDDPRLLVTGWDRLVHPRVPTGRAVQFFAYLSQSRAAKVVSFVAERAEELEQRYAGRPEDRLAILRAVNAWPGQGPAVSVPASHVLAAHRVKALEEIWLAQGRTPETAVAFVRSGMGVLLGFTKSPDGTDPVGRAPLADFLVRHVEVLSAHLRAQWVAHPLGPHGDLEGAVFNALVQCTGLGPEHLAKLDAAWGPVLVEAMTLRLDAAPESLVGFASALRLGASALSVLKRLTADPVVKEAFAAQDTFLTGVGGGDLAAMALTVLQPELDDVMAERASVRCVGGKVLGSIGPHALEPGPRVASRQREYPAELDQRRRFYPSAAQFAPPRLALRRPSEPRATLLEVLVAPCRRKDLPPVTTTARRVLVATSQQRAYGKALELVVTPAGSLTRPNADGQQETWELFTEKHVTEVDALQRALVKELAVTRTEVKRGELAAADARPRLRAAVEALKRRQQP